MWTAWREPVFAHQAISICWAELVVEGSVLRWCLCLAAYLPTACHSGSRRGDMGICTRKAAFTGGDMQSRFRILTALVTDLVAAAVFLIVKVDTFYLGIWFSGEKSLTKLSSRNICTENPIANSILWLHNRVTVLNATELHTLEMVKMGNFVMRILLQLKKISSRVTILSPGSFIDTKGLQLI